MRIVRLIAASGLALCASAGLAAAGPYSALYAFGDSLSDNGNLAEIYQQNFPNPPSNHDSFTNGTVAVGQVAQSLGLPFTPSLWVTGFQDPFKLFGGAGPGTNFAVAGATAQAQAVGGPPAINLPQQVLAFGAATAQHADPNALYVMMIGGNDVRNAALSGTGSAGVSAGVTTELGALATLAGEGARNFLVVNVPNVGAIPEFQLQNPALAGTATALSQSYDAALAAGLAGLGLPGHVTQFDLYGFNTDLFQHAASYGLTDTSDPCFVATPLSPAASAACGPGGAKIGSFAYWDAIHPTAVVHGLWAQGMEQALEVPEPGSLALLAVGALAAIRRRGRGVGGRGLGAGGRAA